jgi:hypothetical protein
MNQVHNIRDGLKSNLGAIKRAAAGSGAGHKHTIAALFSVRVVLGLIRRATRLIEYLLYFRAKSTHRRSLSRCRRVLE